MNNILYKCTWLIRIYKRTHDLIIGENNVGGNPEHNKTKKRENGECQIITTTISMYKKNWFYSP